MATQTDKLFPQWGEYQALLSSIDELQKMRHKVDLPPYPAISTNKMLTIIVFRYENR